MSRLRKFKLTHYLNFDFGQNTRNLPNEFHASAISKTSRTACGERLFSASSRWHCSASFSASARFALASWMVSPWEIAAGTPLRGSEWRFSWAIFGRPFGTQSSSAKHICCREGAQRAAPLGSMGSVAREKLSPFGPRKVDLLQFLGVGQFEFSRLASRLRKSKLTHDLKFYP